MASYWKEKWAFTATPLIIGSDGGHRPNFLARGLHKRSAILEDFYSAKIAGQDFREGKRGMSPGASTTLPNEACSSDLPCPTFPSCIPGSRYMDNVCCSPLGPLPLYLVGKWGPLMAGMGGEVAMAVSISVSHSGKRSTHT